MKTVEGKPNTHYVTTIEWDAGYITGNTLLKKMQEGDIVIFTDRSNTSYQVVVEKSLKPL